MMNIYEVYIILTEMMNIYEVYILLTVMMNIYEVYMILTEMMNIFVCIQTPPMYTIRSITSKLLCAISQFINVASKHP